MTRDPKKLTGEPCPRCGRELISMGVVPFRVGGNPGVLNALLGSWGELGESHVEIEVLACDQCRHIEMRLPEKR